MRERSFTAPLQHLVAGVLVASATPACTDWHIYSVEPAQVIERQHPGTVRIERRDQSRVVVQQPRVEGDAITGVANGRPTTIAIADVTAVAVRQVDWGETILLVATPPAILFGFACLAVCGGY